MKIERAHLNFLAGLATLLLAIEQVLGCSCKNEHPQQQVCRADLVVRGEVVRKTTVPTGNILFPQEIEYAIKVKRIYKGEEFMPETGKIVHIFTPDNDILCGRPDLEEGMKYLITAEFDDYTDRLTIQNCLWNVEWAEITQAQRQGLKHFYSRYCQKCEIEESPRHAPNFYGNAPFSHGNILIFQGNAIGKAERTTCFYEGGECEKLHSSCTKKNGACKWTSNTNYRICKELEGQAS